MRTRSVKPPERVAVIGVGILGAGVGWNLSRRGAKVVFIDAGQPGEGVTHWSFSWVNASNKTASKSYFDLNVKTAEQLAHWDYRAEVYTGAEVRRSLEPALTMPGEVPVVFYPDETWVHGRHLVGRLVGQAVASGAELRSDTAVCDIGTGADGSIRTVALSDGSCLDVNIVVNAAGPRASHVAGLIARHLPMRREPGAVTRIDGRSRTRQRPHRTDTGGPPVHPGRRIPLGGSGAVCAGLLRGRFPQRHHPRAGNRPAACFGDPQREEGGDACGLPPGAVLPVTALASAISTATRRVRLRAPEPVS